jgi:hypothetical protein
MTSILYEFLRSGSRQKSASLVVTAPHLELPTSWLARIELDKNPWKDPAEKTLDGLPQR